MPANVILSRMMDRLFASMARGPCLNCRPHSSRSRLDVTLLSRLRDVEPREMLAGLLSEQRLAMMAGRVPAPPEIRNARGAGAVDRAGFSSAVEIIERAMSESEGMGDAGGVGDAGFDDVAGLPGTIARENPPGQKNEAPAAAPEDEARDAWLQQRAVLTKLRNLVDEARTYEQDTGVAALHVGYPLLSLPAGFARGASSRVLAPIAFIPVSLTVRTGHKPGVDFACRGQGVDRVLPNAALMAWLEQQTGKSAEEMFSDEEGAQPWDEIAALIRQVCAMLDLKTLEPQREDGDRAAQDAPKSGGHVDLRALATAEHLHLLPAPHAENLPSEPAVLACAVVGLYPMAHESLLRDTQAMIEQPSLDGPVTSFVDARVRLETPPEPAVSEQPDAVVKVERAPRRFADERLVALADPCQSRTVAMARQARGLVIHGPPGTGKSQTITNIIGDHLARGERVLFVCDKRTALDVVANRLEHLGLSELCAVVHDPQRDQRDLYLAIREQLDGLAESKTRERAANELEKTDAELQRLHDELTQTHAALMLPPEPQAESFHDLMGRWLSIAPSAETAVNENDLSRATLTDLDTARSDIEVILRRGQAVQYRDNAWVECAGMTLKQFLSRPVAEMRAGLGACVQDAQAADATRHENIPPFNPRQPLAEQASWRSDVAARLRRALAGVDPALARGLAAAPADDLQRMHRQLREAEAPLSILREGPLDAELATIARDAAIGPSQIASQLGAMDDYFATASKWHSFLHFSARSAARNALRGYGLTRSIASAERLKKFLQGLRARNTLADIARQWRGGAAAGTSAPLADQDLTTTFDQHRLALEALVPALGIVDLEARMRAAMRDSAAAEALLDGLDRSSPRAAALGRVEESLNALTMLDAAWLGRAGEQARAGGMIAEGISRLQQQFDSLEGVLRIRDDLMRIKEAFKRSVEDLLKASADAQTGLPALERGVLQGEITRRLSGSAALTQIDSERLAAAFDRYRDLESRKRTLVRDVILHRWRSKQKQRLVVSTGSRLNSEGAQMRQRLFVRGSRAMRLRQVIAIGRQSQGVDGDPLFDLCPVWLASPETVAQMFPRTPLFDVVVFDEASQCKLEEALPVLTRARRVVVAGDPKQLPPTRFFETSIAESDDTALESDQDVFEAQQAEIEDLLAAALNLEIEESYLDVHYRSRNADLIEFSNQQFYQSRLQPIPGHPSNRTPFAPITLYRVDGLYDRRCNVPEAKRVCEIVRDLLKRAEPPSIGIACFNLTQRDLIVELLDEMAADDSAFASRLEKARERRGEASFEGLFVKNLENVQGDERDHIIISTTYGRNKDGKFYRRFGPLGMSGGGRRLNVLVTRARHEVHLVTSIPREAYVNGETIPEGATPNGGWLLFAYLRFAEELADVYEISNRMVSEAHDATEARVIEKPIEPFSAFALALARQLAQTARIGSDVHWGNTGFRVDAALHHPKRAESVTLGVLCDFARYARAQDAVEWDIFRTGIHESQGWRLHRVWSPQYFRDATRVVNSITRDVQEFLTKEIAGKAS